jgi:hypothetical protein
MSGNATNQDFGISQGLQSQRLACKEAYPVEMPTPMKLYKPIDVWKRVDENNAVRYRCFESLESKLFSVQSADFYRLPSNDQQNVNLVRQFVELFLQEDPAKRGGEHGTIEEAIAAHDKAFS